MNRVFFVLFFILFLSNITNIPKDIVMAQETDVNVRDPFLTCLPEKLQKAQEQAVSKKKEFEKSIPQEEIIPPNLTIKGLIWNTDLPQAIVNDSIIRIGDIIDEAEVLDITKEGISIRYRSKEFFVKAQLSIVSSEKDRR